MLKVLRCGLILLCIFLYAHSISGDLNTCSIKTSCSACIQTVDCVWCSQPMSKDAESFARCMHKSYVGNSKWCTTVENPSSSIHITENAAAGTSNNKEETIQISPQHVKLKLRVGEEVNVSFQYQQAVGYPVDLYYLMDLSASMADDKEKLSTLGNKLISTMKSVTNNFRIGFGSFVDKPEMPYVNTVPSKLAVPCTLKDGTSCAPPYSFKNQMPLNGDTGTFAREVKKAPVSGNMDYPEGGFDALMQVLVCKDKIGWRERARKIVIFSTDAGFHMAGDGKLAGIIEPNDGLCHLDNNGTYTHSLVQDYPSVSMLDMKVRENNINVIFAVPKNQQKEYRLLKDNIYGASYGTLSQDSSNVVDLLKAEYDKLVDSIVFSDDAQGSIEIKYFSTCIGTEEKQTNECENLRGRPLLNFTAVVKAASCPKNKDKWHQMINIKPGALNESLTLEVDIICSCDCENEQVQIKSEECSNGGSLQCGICSCDSERYGKFCECDGNKLTSSKQEDCKPTNTTDQICSGLGFCKCGKCECNKREDTNERIYGTYCECDNFSCNINAGLVCSGPEQGRCDCGKCICELGWGGSACECKENNSTCTSPKTGKVCSDHGVCKCGACVCDKTGNFRYSGEFCEECPHCTETKCVELKKCVECKVHKSDIDCNTDCSNYQIEEVEKIEVEEESDASTERICRLPDNSGCTTVFKYKYDDDGQGIKIYAEKSKQCTAVIDVLGVILGVVGSTVIAGLILLIVWKIVTTMYDKREYEKFEKETMNAKWDNGDNPLYKPSTSLFQNPMYNN